VLSTRYQLALIASISHLSQLAKCDGYEYRSTHRHTTYATHQPTQTHSLSQGKGPLKCISIDLLCVWVGFPGKWYKISVFPSGSMQVSKWDNTDTHTHTHTAIRHTHTTVTTVYIGYTYMYSTKVGQLLHARTYIVSYTNNSTCKLKIKIKYEGTTLAPKFIVKYLYINSCICSLWFYIFTH